MVPSIDRLTGSIAYPKQAKDQVKFQAAEARLRFTGTWETDLLHAPCAQPLCCCTAIFCPCCVSYALRVQLLRGDMSQYSCCQGYMPCSNKCGEKSCPEFCLCCETFVCFAQSVMATRWVLQDTLLIQNTKCDNCLITTAVVLQYLSCILDIVACIVDIPALDKAAAILDLIADCVWCSVCACMAAQHKEQMEIRDGKKQPRARDVEPPAVQAPMSRT